MKRQNLVVYQLFIVFFTIAFFCCKKKDTPTPVIVTPPVTPPVTTNPISKIGGLWSMHGTIDIYSFNGTSYLHTHDTEVETMTIYLVDSVTIVVKRDNYVYSTQVVTNTSDSTITFSDVFYGGVSVVYNFVNNTIFWERAQHNYTIYEKLYSSPTHSTVKNNVFGSIAAKMAGTKQWHGTYHTIYIPGGGQPDVDTTFYDSLKMQINAIADTLILDRIYYVGKNSVFQYLVFSKTFTDQSKTVFSAQGNPYQTITFYSIDNSMFYFDSSASGILSVSKYYTP